MGYKKDDPCIKKAYDNERLFVLMTRDAEAPRTIIHWISRSLGKQPPEKLHEALDCAIQMYNDQPAIVERIKEDKDAQAVKNFDEI